MYAYDELDRTIINERVEEFRDQVKRRLSGELTEDEFKILRLQNGVYLQLHAYMLRIAVPYGTLNPRQVRQLAYIAPVDVNESGRIEPGNLREHIRSEGLTIGLAVSA